MTTGEMNMETETARKDGRVMRKLSAGMVTTDKGHIRYLRATSEDRHPTVLVVGDRFMNGEFVPASELEKAYRAWDGRYHNLNHGKNFNGLVEVQEIVGVYTNSRMQGKSVLVDIIEGEQTQNYAAWKGFLALNEKAGRPANVSMEVYANIRQMPYREIQGLVEKDDAYASMMRFKDDDMVSVLVDIEPVGGATVDRGAGGDDCSHMRMEAMVEVDTSQTSSDQQIPGEQTMTQEESGSTNRQQRQMRQEETPMAETQTTQTPAQAPAPTNNPALVNTETATSTPITMNDKHQTDELVKMQKTIADLQNTVKTMQARPVTGIQPPVTQHNGEYIGVTACRSIIKRLQSKPATDGGE